MTDPGGPDDPHRTRTDRFAGQYFPARPEPGFSRPNSAPAYYQGRPAHLWITVMRPRRGHTTSATAVTERVAALAAVSPPPPPAGGWK
jgi:hypothetical protein